MSILRRACFAFLKAIAFRVALLRMLRLFRVVFCSLFVALSLFGCAAQMTVNDSTTLEDLHALNPRAWTAKICVRPNSVPSDTRFWTFHVNRNEMVSDHHPYFLTFVEQADGIYEFDDDAPPDSAGRIPPSHYGGTCKNPYAGEVDPTLAIPADLHRRLSQAVMQTCRVARNDRPNQRFMAQQSGSRLGPIGVGIDAWKRLVAETLRSGKPVTEPPPQTDSEPRAVDHPAAQLGGGVASGVSVGLVPGGTFVADAAIASGKLPRGSKWACVGKAIGEFAAGAGQIVVGCGGMTAGAGITGTGAGAPAGVAVFVGSLGITMNGVATCSNGIRHLTLELWRTEDSASSSGPPSSAPEASPAPAPKPAAAPPPQAAKPAQAPPQGAKPPPTKVQTNPETGTVTRTWVKPAPAAELKPYGGPGGGHHVPAKKAFEGTPGYDPKKALAIPNAELKALGVDHQKVTTAQRLAYIDFAKTGKPLTWEAVAKIETDALVKGEMKLETARATVAKAIQALKDAGVAAPVRIPWGK